MKASNVIKSLQQALISKYINEPEEPLKCNQCGKAFLKTNSLYTHKSTYSWEKCFDFNQCSYTFSKSSHEQNHKRTHIGERFLNVSNVLLHLIHKAVVSKYIKKYIQERNPMNIINVLKPFYITIIFKSVKNMRWKEILWISLIR